VYLKNLGGMKENMAKFNVVSSAAAMARGFDPSSSSAAQRPTMDELMKNGVRVYVHGEGSSLKACMCFAEDGMAEGLEAQGWMLIEAPLVTPTLPSAPAAVHAATQSSPISSPSRRPHQSDSVNVGAAGSAARAPTPPPPPRPPPATISLPLSVPELADTAGGAALLTAVEDGGKVGNVRYPPLAEWTMASQAAWKWLDAKVRTNNYARFRERMNAYYALVKGELGQKKTMNSLKVEGAKLVKVEGIVSYDEVRKIVEIRRTRNLAVAGLPASANM